MKLYRLDEVAALLGVSMSTVRRLLTNGGLVHVRVGGQNRVRDTDLSAFIASNTSSASSAARH